MKRKLDSFECNQIWSSTKAASPNILALEASYKVLTKWYLVPARVAKYVPNYSAQCFRGCSELGTLFHIWWLCPKAQIFWKEIFTLKRIKEELEWYFKINVPGEVNEATVWEAHKGYIRGILMMVGTGKKKRWKKEKLALIKEIHELEQQHKTSGGRETWINLQKRREELRACTEQEMHKIYNLVKKDRYINGNKPGKLLARALKKRKQVIL